MILKVVVALLLVLAATMAVGTQTQMIVPAKAQIPSDVDQYALPGGTVFWYADYSTGDQSQFSTNPVSAYPIGGSEIMNTCNGIVAVSSSPAYGGAYGGITHNGEPYAGYYSANTAEDTSAAASDGNACHVDPDMWSIGGKQWTSVYDEAWFYVPTQPLSTSCSGTGCWVSFDGWCDESCLGGGVASAPVATKNLVQSSTVTGQLPQNVGAAVQWPLNQWFQISILALSMGTPQATFAVYYNGNMIMEYQSQAYGDGAFAIHWGAYTSPSQQTWTIYNADLLLEDMTGLTSLPATVPTGSGTVASTTPSTQTTASTTPTPTAPIWTTWTTSTTTSCKHQEPHCKK
jgi:hypothetical protein